MLTKFKLISLLAVVSFLSGCWWDDPSPTAPKREPRNTFSDFQHIGGPVSGVWTKENNPHVITGITKVMEGDTLRIQAGVEIVAQNSIDILSNGVLVFEGTSESPIRYVHNSAVLGGGGFVFSGKVSAKHVVFEGNGKSFVVDRSAYFEHVTFAEFRLVVNSEGSVRNDSVVIRNCVFAGFRPWLYSLGGAQISSYGTTILDSTRTDIRNNLFYTAIGNPAWVLDPDPVVDLQIQGKGEVKRIRGTTYPGNGNIFADPKWVKYEYVGPSPAGISNNDYRLQPVSPAIGAAHDGTNIGAY